ncbi:hypothetical protein CAPTEDRAFT_187194 [Capitella teleta]|uniref:Uncharacterized protein n=1 Tax=Capitella teleta TaxID=283909 RepID=R7VG01_CAPTE|nr:hypothetical protein CAPTEDRAFT_187194 [Capitella teleta]|eukprot:ELU15211.1 hypothetical protein CAPTEDRAFT_187194 [Capitella teleta]
MPKHFGWKQDKSGSNEYAGWCTGRSNGGLIACIIQLNCLSRRNEHKRYVNLLTFLLPGDNYTRPEYRVCIGVIISGSSSRQRQSACWLFDLSVESKGQHLTIILVIVASVLVTLVIVSIVICCCET